MVFDSNFAFMKDHKFNYSLYFISIFPSVPINALASNAQMHTDADCNPTNGYPYMHMHIDKGTVYSIHTYRVHRLNVYSEYQREKKHTKTIDCILTSGQHVRIHVLSQIFI